MQAFEYANPGTLREAVGLLPAAWGEAEVLAGGTDLLSLMKSYVVTPKRVVDVKNVVELKGIREQGSGIRVGALVTLQELIDSDLMRRSFPSLVTAAEGVNSMQIRNRGTVGGDLCQRPRCWYFRSGYGLLARDAEGKSLVPGGDNRYHAILGNGGPAYFVNASSLAPALIALEAAAQVTGPRGARTVPLAEFYRTPTADGQRETVLQPNEIVSEIVIPAASRGRRNASYEVRQREMLDWPLATASVALEMNGANVRQARIVLGHVAPVPWRSVEAERAITGQPINEDTATRAGESAVGGARPLSGNAYKVQLARVVVKRALLAAGRGA